MFGFMKRHLCDSWEKKVVAHISAIAIIKEFWRPAYLAPRI
jgi:hypothetical protein